jgi:hypothetical protein
MSAGAPRGAVAGLGSVLYVPRSRDNSGYFHRVPRHVEHSDPRSTVRSPRWQGRTGASEGDCPTRVPGSGVGVPVPKPRDEA